MELLPACILAIIQGITEFLPISSSGHLVLIPIFFDWPDQGIAFDVALHFGSLLAILFFFRRVLREQWQDFKQNNIRQFTSQTLISQIAIATIPACIVGFFLHDIINLYLRSPAVIATTSIVFAILLWWADRRNIVGSLEKLSLWQAFLIGCMQALALIPGTSRSGITISGGLLLGLSRHRATEFSFLLAIPTIALAFLYETFRLLRSDFDGIAPGPTLVAVTVSAISSYLAMKFLFFWVRKRRFTPFVIYRILLGLSLWLLIFSKSLTHG